jgi:broad specificity phosphatase PhoE
VPVPSGRPLAVVHSPLERAAATAARIAAALGGAVPLRAEPAFVEIGQGDWEGRLASDIQATDADRLAAWRRTPTEAWAPGGERLADVQDRVVPGLAAILAELAAAGPAGSIHAPQVAGYRDVDTPSDQPWTILVGHDGVFKVVLCTLFDLPLERFWMWSSELCGISIVELRAGRPVIRALNLTEHLAALRDEDAVEAAEDRARSGAL